ncbi:fumarylacetoacetase [Hydrogenophaga pseudoflava]|uniref:fumarylacetoacetase n=1 Tax=Hydrogenophaga pseudoflava TaxID=47421 RepID=A0A4P6WUN2_HYDPS|nr:fumarylacetoacetase [Hydrogenophaga pseudoflava]QBM26196.1 Fumarylacetoacetate (FAA) hydrolase family protein [Hydrogenophaga pseudoflava]
MTLNHTHDPAARSWLTSANEPGTDFPIQNLPFGVFRRRGTGEPFRGGVAIGDQVIDLAAVSASGVLDGLAADAARAAAQPALNDLLAMGPAAWRALRHALFAALRHDADATVVSALHACLVPQSAVEHSVPTRIGDYTDFYTSIHHARNVGRVIRPDDPLTPNFQWIPIAYHGRASSVVISGTPFHRPHGQAMAPGASAPVYGPCRRLDYELEMGFYVGPGNALGQPIPIGEAEQHIFGMCLLNDWSARDHQFWEMAPLGPFLGKNFCTSVSPWIVTMEALAPYRVPFAHPADEPQPLPYLDSAANSAQGGVDVQLEVLLESAQHRAKGVAPDRLSATSFRHQYWTIAQMLTQHANNGCNLQPGDLLGTGTISGPTYEEAGAIVELSLGGTRQIPLAATGETRTFLEDGDTVVLRGWCEKPGAARIGFGECRGEVLPAIAG